MEAYHMMTWREAMQRANMYGARIARTGNGAELRVTLGKWTRREAEEKAYFTDDLEDAVLKLGRLA